MADSGGILLVRLSSGGVFVNDPDRKKFDPANPSDQVVEENVRKWWRIARLIEQWKAGGEWPKVIAGLAGPLKRRYVAGALAIDADGEWVHEPSGWEVPVRSKDVDAKGLRGQLVSDARFGQGRHQHFVWVDDQGVIRYPDPNNTGTVSPAV
jgi:hypothetical protein